MGERTVTAPIDPIDRGIDRLDTNVRAGKIAEGLNVINDDGDLRRRDAFKTIYTAAPHFLPPGLVSVQASDRTAEETLTGFANRAGSILASTPLLYDGCEEKFDGFDLGSVAFSTAPAEGLFLKGYYSTGDDWEEIPFLFDTTSLGQYKADNTAYYSTTLCKEGRVSWHTRGLTGWATTTTGTGGGALGSTKYWIYVSIYAASGDRGTLPGTSVITAPGIRAFHLAKVNGLFPLRTKKRDTLVICSDREERRGSEKGAMLGLASSTRDATKQLHVVQDEGSGTYNRVTIPQWSSASGATLPPNHTATGSTNFYGATGVLERKKTTDTVDWYTSGTSDESEWRGGQALYVAFGNVVDGGSTTLIQITSTAGVVANQYEHHLLRYIGGTYDGEERMITKNTASDSGDVDLHVDDEFTAGPDGATSIKIYRPHSRVEIKPSQRDYEVSSNAATTVTLTSSRPWVPAVETADPYDINEEAVSFYISRSPRWSIPSGTNWTATYDNNSNSLYLANDHSEILRFDGTRLRVLYPETDTDKDWHAERYANFTFLSEESKAAAISNGITETAFLENSPVLAHILVSFLRRLFAIKTGTADSMLRFSGESAFHVWPSHFIRAIPDDRNREIQGAAGINNRLLIWTSNAIMEFLFIESEDQFDSRVLYAGAGFVSHHGVQVIKSTLVGPNTDGLYAFNGSNMEPVLDDWSRLIKGGINPNRLNRSSSVHIKEKGWYMLAVSSAGKDYNDKIVIWDYTRNRFWLWSAPHGASFLAKDYDENGDERLLIGTDDGHVQTLADQEKDDGVAIDSYARTVPLNLFEAREAAYTSVQSVVQNTSSAMDLKFFVDKRETESKAITMSADAGLSKLGTVTITGALGDTRYKTVNNNLNLKGRDFQVQIGGAAPWRLRRMYITARDLGKR